MKPVITILFVAIVLASLVETIRGECCPATKNTQFNGIGFMNTDCEDNTKGTPCCGYGPCNIFCCNCDGGCRTARKRGEGAEDLVKVDGFEVIDTDRDGRISLSEAEQHISAGNCGNPAEKLPKIPMEFGRMDLDSDGFLSREEIDSP